MATKIQIDYHIPIPSGSLRSRGTVWHFEEYLYKGASYFYPGKTAKQAGNAIHQFKSSSEERSSWDFTKLDRQEKDEHGNLVEGVRVWRTNGDPHPGEEGAGEGEPSQGIANTGRVTRAEVTNQLRELNKR